MVMVVVMVTVHGCLVEANYIAFPVLTFVFAMDIVGLCVCMAYLELTSTLCGKRASLLWNDVYPLG